MEPKPVSLIPQRLFIWCLGNESTIKTSDKSGAGAQRIYATQEQLDYDVCRARTDCEYRLKCATYQQQRLIEGDIEVIINIETPTRPGRAEGGIMNANITIDINEKIDEVKGITGMTPTYMKTKTKLDIHFTKEQTPDLDELIKDMTHLKADGLPVASIQMTVEGAPSIGRIINRSVTAFARIGLDLSEMEWDAKAGEIIVVGENLSGMDAPYVADILAKMVIRSLSKVGDTHHALTLYDLKQAIGHVHDLKMKVDGSQDLANWFDVREAVILEEEKEARAATAKAKRDEAKEKRAAAKPKVTKAKAKAAVKNVKGKAKAGKGKAASLSDLD